jgi:predicted nucleotidyltransferase
MSVNSGFDDVQAEADADIQQVRKARKRRDDFKAGLSRRADISEIRLSGSLARGTHKDPIHDVDLIAVFDAAEHPGWGESGTSSEEALEHMRGLVKEQFGADGTGDVRLTRIQNHAVKCFLDDPEDPDAFTVDVAPALIRPEGGIFIPEKKSARWTPSDPKYLIDRVAERHAEWNLFARLVRVLKRWNSDHGGHMKSLVVEVLALEHLREADRPDALAQFFTAAADAVWYPIEDPAGLCGEIQPNLDQAAASAELAAAADNASRALEAASRGENAQAMCLWRKVFGPIYPEPPGGCDRRSPALIPAAPKRRVVDSPQG